jgi:hypothetical protein
MEFRHREAATSCARSWSDAPAVDGEQGSAGQTFVHLSHTPFIYWSDFIPAFLAERRDNLSNL